MSKYVAAGFIVDAQKLYNDLSKCQIKDFTTFCDVWKKYNFGCIFMGRPDPKELTEFINEIYQLTLNYMVSSSLESQIAAIYLLYALYRNQDVTSPVKIRISKLQYRIVQQVHAYATKERVYTLHYITEYLKRNCLELVANSTLFGPLCSFNKDDLVKSKTNQFVILSDLKQNMTIFQENGTIANLKDMRDQYLNLKNNIMPVTAAVKDNESMVTNGYNENIQKLNKILGENSNAAKCTRSYTVESKAKSLAVQSNINHSAVEESSIGRRRLELKHAASEMKVPLSKTKYQENVQVPENNKVANEGKMSLKKKRSYNKRLPVNERRMGRPRKHAKKIEASSESEDSDFKYSFQILPTQDTKTKRGPIGRRKASYLTNYEGPVILTSKREPVNDCSDTSDESVEDQFLEF